MPNRKLRMEGHGKQKIDRNDAHHMGDPCSHLEVERSKMKFSRLINAEMENVPYIPYKGWEHIVVATLQAAQLVDCVFCFVTCIKEELLSIQLMQIVAKCSRDHAGYVSYGGRS